MNTTADTLTANKTYNANTGIQTGGNTPTNGLVNLHGANRNIIVVSRR